MVDAVTPRYGLVKPEVNASRNSWGDKTNSNWDKVDISLGIADWTAITGKPSTFPPTLPIAWADVSGKPATFPPTLPIAWADVSGKPATFPPSTHGHPQSEITNLVADLALKAPLASPTFTGDPKAPTPATADDDTSIATTAYVKANLAAIVGGAIISDTPPVSPKVGQLWFESDTGSTYIWFNDGTSTQWVQINVGPGGPKGDQGIQGIQGEQGIQGPQGLIADAPSDGGEYVRVNGVWRLKSQSFDLAGKTTQDITVPAWGPKSARVTMTDAYTVTSNSTQAALLLSVDGTTFPNASGNYSLSGFYHTAPAAAIASGLGLAAAAFITLTPADNNYSMPMIAEAIIGLVRNAGGGLFGAQVRGHGYNASGLQSIYYYYNMSAAAFPGSGPVTAMRWLSTPAVALVSGSLTVEWL